MEGEEIEDHDMLDDDFMLSERDVDIDNERLIQEMENDPEFMNIFLTEDREGDNPPLDLTLDEEVLNNGNDEVGNTELTNGEPQQPRLLRVNQPTSIGEPFSSDEPEGEALGQQNHWRTESNSGGGENFTDQNEIEIVSPPEQRPVVAATNNVRRTIKIFPSVLRTRQQENISNGPVIDSTSGHENNDELPQVETDSSLTFVKGYPFKEEFHEIMKEIDRLSNLLEQRGEFMYFVTVRCWGSMDSFESPPSSMYEWLECVLFQMTVIRPDIPLKRHLDRDFNAREMIVPNKFEDIDFQVTPSTTERNRKRGLKKKRVNFGKPSSPTNTQKSLKHRSLRIPHIIIRYYISLVIGRGGVDKRMKNKGKTDTNFIRLYRHLRTFLEKFFYPKVNLDCRLKRNMLKLIQELQVMKSCAPINLKGSVVDYFETTDPSMNLVSDLLLSHYKKYGNLDTNKFLDECTKEMMERICEKEIFLGWVLRANYFIFGDEEEQIVKKICVGARRRINDDK